MPGVIANRRRKLIFAEALDLLACPLFLGAADFHDQVSPRGEKSASLVHQPIKHLETALAAVKGEHRLVVLDADRQLVQLFAGDVRRVADDEVESLALAQR